MRIKEMISNKRSSSYCYTNSLCQHHREIYIKCMENIYTDVSVIRVNKRGLLNGFIFFPGNWLDKRE